MFLNKTFVACCIEFFSEFVINLKIYLSDFNYVAAIVSEEVIVLNVGKPFG